jgi:hypothetical protein
MSADIMSTQAPSTSARLKRGSERASKPNQPLVDQRPQDDPALIIGLALACHLRCRRAYFAWASPVGYSSGHQVANDAKTISGTTAKSRN